MHSPRFLLVSSLIFSTAAAPETRKGRMSRRGAIIVLLTVGIVLDLLISVALFYAVQRARDASSQVHLVKVSAYEACLISNDQRAADLRRWNDILALVNQGPATPARDRFIDGVRKANGTADKPRDCGTLVP